MILDYTYMTLKYPDAITFFLSCWLRKEGIAIESARKIVEGLADDDDKLHDRLATLEDTYSKAQMKSKGTKSCFKFLKLNLAAQTKAHQILKEVQDVFPESRRHDNGAASNLADSRTHRDGHQFPQPQR